MAASDTQEQPAEKRPSHKGDGSLMRRVHTGQVALPRTFRTLNAPSLTSSIMTVDPHYETFCYKQRDSLGAESRTQETFYLLDKETKHTKEPPPSASAQCLCLTWGSSTQWTLSQCVISVTVPRAAWHQTPASSVMLMIISLFADKITQ